MLIKRYRLWIIIVLIAFSLGGLGYIKLKTYSQITYPAISVRISHNLYFISTSDGFLYNTNTDTKVSHRLVNDKIDCLGIIVFKNKLYYVNKISKRLCSIELNGKNIKAIDRCNIIMPFQPLFKLGVHIYYYNSENKLIRIDDRGFKEKIVKGVEFWNNI
jgi:hypothetical protein